MQENTNTQPKRRRHRRKPKKVVHVHNPVGSEAQDPYSTGVARSNDVVYDILVDALLIPAREGKSGDSFAEGQIKESDLAAMGANIAVLLDQGIIARAGIIAASDVSDKIVTPQQLVRPNRVGGSIMIPDPRLNIHGRLING